MSRGETVSKLCECGCGEMAPIATTTDRPRGYIKGEPRRFVNGHANRGRAKNGGLSFDKDSRRWKIICRDGTQLWYYRGVMAAHIGRLLEPHELVHHVNENTSDDRIENLEMTTRPDHLETHRPGHDQQKRADSIRAAHARKTPEERSAIALKSWTTRRAAA